MYINMSCIKIQNILGYYKEATFKGKSYNYRKPDVENIEQYMEAIFKGKS